MKLTKLSESIEGLFGKVLDSILEDSNGGMGAR